MMDHRNYENLKIWEIKRLLDERMPEVSKWSAEIPDVWVDEEITPHIYYSYSFTPLLQSLFSGDGDHQVLKRAMKLIEDLATSTDPLVGDIVVTAILEPLLADIVPTATFRNMVGPKTKRIIKRMLK